MPTIRPLALLICGCSMLVPSVAAVHADSATATHRSESADSVSAGRRGNICLGGLEDGKLIPNDDRVDNPFKQTTLLGCSVEGGSPVFLPDLKPAIANGILA